MEESKFDFTFNVNFEYDRFIASYLEKGKQGPQANGASHQHILNIDKRKR